uniref:Uncharacterized protein n=1 Tax=Anguilla anguilla TaxID=7936 RepID=A0A0E9S555_ANGAN
MVNNSRTHLFPPACDPQRPFLLPIKEKKNRPPIKG